MAETKGKIVTVESLAALHEYNNDTYETKVNVETLKTNIVNMLNDKFSRPVLMTNGGTGATSGAAGLKNLFSAGATVISHYQYGDELPEAGTVGRIFFKRLVE